MGSFDTITIEDLKDVYGTDDITTIPGFEAYNPNSSFYDKFSQQQAPSIQVNKKPIQVNTNIEKPFDDFFDVIGKGLGYVADAPRWATQQATVGIGNAIDSLDGRDDWSDETLGQVGNVLGTAVNIGTRFIPGVGLALLGADAANGVNNFVRGEDHLGNEISGLERGLGLASAIPFAGKLAGGAGKLIKGGANLVDKSARAGAGISRGVKGAQSAKTISDTFSRAMKGYHGTQNATATSGGKLGHVLANTGKARSLVDKVTPYTNKLTAQGRIGKNAIKFNQLVNSNEQSDNNILYDAWTSPGVISDILTDTANHVAGYRGEE
jgi:hypothetical protein